MPGGKLIRKSGVKRYILSAAHECLAWAYKRYENPRRCQLEFWSWAMGLHTWQLLRPDTPAAKGLLEASGGWPWLQLQRRTRRFLEKLFAGIGSDKPPLVRVMPRGLLPAPVDGEGIVLRWRSPVTWPEKPWDWVMFLLDDLLSDLDGVSLDVVGRCALCNHYFIRAAARRKNYCSDTCRNRAVYQRRKGKRKHGQRTLQLAPKRAGRSEQRKP
jgi:hypothetical protein